MLNMELCFYKNLKMLVLNMMNNIEMQRKRHFLILSYTQTLFLFSEC